MTQIPHLPPAMTLPVETIRRMKKRDILVQEAVLYADRNRWFLISCCLLLLLGLSLVEIIITHHRLEHELKVAWVKMSPSGSWNIEFYDQDRNVEFFPATVDYMLSRFVERRYSKISASIRFDYGFAQQLMAPNLASSFTSTSGFNAPQVASDFLNCATCPEVTIQIRSVDHFDSEKTQFNNLAGNLYRTNVFVRETTRYQDGSIKEEANRIVSITWRLKSKEEILANKPLLRINPIGIEILSSNYLNDPAPLTPTPSSKASL